MKIDKLLSVSALIIVSSIAQAHEKVYTAFLSGAAESPSNDSLGTGFTTVTFDLDLFTMRVEATFSGLTGTVTASHIHGPTAIAGQANAGVATQTPSFTGFPTGVSSGTYDHTFDMALASSYNAAFITANGGTVSTAFDALEAAFDAGKAYLNIHSTYKSGGEIRGFLAAVPEPSSYALLVGAATLAVVAARRRR